jgi:hypothetical protein
VSTRTATPINLYVDEAARKLQQHSDPQQQVVILRDLRELIDSIDGELSVYHKDQIKSALAVGLGHDWVHTPEFTPFDNEEGELQSSPIDNLVDCMSDLGMKSAYFQLSESEKNVGQFLDIGQPMKITYSNFEDNGEDEDQPVDKLTLEWIEETRNRLASSGKSHSIDLVLTASDASWSVRRYLRDFVSGYDPEEILYVFGGADSIQASLTIGPNTTIAEVNGLLVLEELEVNVKFGFLLEDGDFDISSEMMDEGWEEHTGPGVDVTRVAFNPETNSFTSCKVYGYNDI